MINVQSARDAATQLVMFGAWSIGDLYSASSKADPDTQNEGTYNLIFPYLHSDFPTREEVFQFISDTFDNHDNANLHNGDYQNPRIPGFTVIPPIEKDNLEKVNNEGIKVKAESTVDAIGYGI